MKTLQYWGTGNFQEHPYTGRIVTWVEKEKQTVDDAIATKLLAANAGFVLDNDESGEVVTSQINSVTGRIEVSGGDLTIAASAGTVDLDASVVSDGYFCHLYAPNQDVCDPYLADISGALNHATFGAGLSKSECWSTAGYAATLATATDEVLHMPAINFDMAGGESLLFVWRGQITAPASALPFIGDSAGSSSKGIAPMRIMTDGTCQGYVSGGAGLSSFFAISPVVADGTIHTYGLVLDGVANKYHLYVDGVAAGGLTALTSRDTATTNQFMIGNTQATLWANTTSLTSKTKALVILRGRTGLGLPADYDDLVKQIMLNPGKLVTKAAW